MWWGRRSKTACFWVRRALIGGSAAFHLAGNSEEPDRVWQVEQNTQKREVVTTSRKVTSDLNKTLLNIRLYQYQSCPFCCKVRAFLDYYGLAYDLIEVNPITKTQLHFSPHYKKVPILVADDHRILTESSLIVSILTTFLHRRNRSLDDVVGLYPEIKSFDPNAHKEIRQHPNKYFIMFEDAKLSDEQFHNLREEREWRQWVDEHFIHLISPNVYRSWAESLATFRWFSEVGRWHEVFPAWERYLTIYVGALVMFFVSKRLKKRHGIVDERAALVDACDQWISALGNRTFLGGNHPNLADLALYGAMNSFYGCTAFTEMLKRTQIGVWFERMRIMVDSHAGCALIRTWSN